ncbi:MAG: hypothetical protein KatS3mg124_0392 [Porticoccaceae bacterium]|nr:MAG: hypothetical protein KatS3mg124_0392 [Porticoccaceae bacterium]
MDREGLSLRGGRFFVTGTDTEVGKTLVAAALVWRARRRGLRALAAKPLAAGASGGSGRPVNEDARLLWEAQGGELPLELVNPICLPEPVAPHVAAAAVGLDLSVAKLLTGIAPLLAAPADLVLVEGAGGWRVPLNERQTLADFAVALGWPVILVVALRLGCPEPRPAERGGDPPRRPAPRRLGGQRRRARAHGPPPGKRGHLGALARGSLSRALAPSPRGRLSRGGGAPALAGGSGGRRIQRRIFGSPLEGTP